MNERTSGVLDLAGLAYRLYRLKQELLEYWEHRPNSFTRDKKRLEDALGRLGLGLMWQDSEERYMVYSLDSIKE